MVAQISMVKHCGGDCKVHKPCAKQVVYLLLFTLILIREVLNWLG